MNFKKYAILSMGLWVLGFGVYESQPAIARADEQTTTSKLVKTTLSSGNNVYWYDGSVKLPDVTGDDLTNPVVAHFSEGQSEVGTKNVTITVDPVENTSYTFSNELDGNGKITLQSKVTVGNVTVKYVDTDGNEISASTTASHSDNPADSDYLNYTTKQLNINGYTFVKMDETSLPANGTLTGTGGTVIYVYRANDAGTVTDSANTSNVTTSDNDEATDNNSNQVAVQQPAQTDSSAADTSTGTSTSTTDSTDLLKSNNASTNSVNQLQKSGLLSQPVTSGTDSSSKSNTGTSETVGQSGADQGDAPESNTDYYITLASFSLVSVIGLVGISIIKH
ncbi:MucBP domain-containing protein [Companilactobacillus jidongensis]|uniref:MucBP domain-containing protein n=1 Tax=Companilactobacillus jidongensis TaxID=2486006 RepID=UPI000F788EE5|nr:MucBP domain-containing protein [Companilactobacillus jidongensis]